MAAAAQIASGSWSDGRVGPLWELFFRFGPPRWSQYIRSNWAGQRLVIAMPYLWLLLFFLIPFLIVLKISFAEFSPLGRPPFEPILQLGGRRGHAAQAGVQQLHVPAARAAVRQRLAVLGQGGAGLDAASAC